LILRANFGRAGEEQWASANYIRSGSVTDRLAPTLRLIPVELTHHLSVVMPGLVPGTHVFCATKEGVGGRDKPGHDELGDSA
jgi:hypothetical protein